MKSIIAQITDRVTPSELIGKYVTLKRKGHDFLGICPFHHEKTPSFTVNDNKGFFHCFGCHQHGSVIDFVMKHDHLDFVDAVKKIGEQYGINTRISQKDQVKQNYTELLESVLDTAQKWFVKEYNMYSNAQSYCYSRKLSDEIIEKYGIGYVPRYSDLINYLRKQGFTDEVIVDSGLAWRREDNSIGDSFIERLMIPIYNLKGKVVAFGGRTLELDNKNIAKYKNSHESQVFKKREIVFNLNRVKKTASRKVIIAEGYMDVIAFSKIGIDYAVAPLGTALTYEQMQMIWRFDPEPVICFDGDKAGINGMFKGFVNAVAEHLTPEKGVKFIIIPDGMDPDDLINKNPAKMQDLLANPLDMVDFIWYYHFEMSELPKTVENLAKIDNEITKTLNLIADKARRENFRQYLKSKIRAENFNLTKNNNLWKSRGLAAVQTISIKYPDIIDAKTRYVAHMLYLSMKYNDLVHDEFDINSFEVDPAINSVTDCEILLNEPFKVLLPKNICQENVALYFNYFNKLYQLEVLNENLRNHFENVGMDNQKKASLIKSEILLCKQEIESIKEQIS